MVADTVLQGPTSGGLAAALHSRSLEVRHLCGGNTFHSSQNWWAASTHALHAITHRPPSGQVPVSVNDRLV